MSQLSKCLKFVTFRGVILYRMQSFLSLRIDLNFRHLLSCDIIGSTWEQDAETFQASESYVCRLYGRKLEESECSSLQNFKEIYEEKALSIMLGNIKTSLQAFIFCCQIVDAVSSELY